MADKIGISPSPEAEILRQIEELIRKVATDQATTRDMQRLQELQKARVGLMRPKSLSLNAVQSDEDEPFKQYA